MKTDKNNVFDLENEDDIPQININLGLNRIQANIIKSAIDIGKTKAKDIMIPMTKAYMLNYDAKFDKTKLLEVINIGYTRIPVYKDNNENHLFGILRVKKFIGEKFNFETCTTLRDTLYFLKIKVSKPIIVSPDTSLIELLRFFKKGRSHMAFVTEKADAYRKQIGLDDNNSEKDGNLRETTYFKTEESTQVLGKLIL